VLTSDQWYYNPAEGTISVSWSVAVETDLSDKVLLAIPAGGVNLSQTGLNEDNIAAEAYLVDENEVMTRPVDLLAEGQESVSTGDYQLFQNIPNPFGGQTQIRYSLPQDEVVTLIVHDLAGSQVFVREMHGRAGLNEIAIRNQDLGKSGMYYYTLYTQNASFTRKMSFIHD
jgi:hypothetical protein